MHVLYFECSEEKHSPRPSVEDPTRSRERSCRRGGVRRGGAGADRQARVVHGSPSRPPPPPSAFSVSQYSHSLECASGIWGAHMWVLTSLPVHTVHAAHLTPRLCFPSLSPQALVHAYELEAQLKASNHHPRPAGFPQPSYQLVGRSPLECQGAGQYILEIGSIAHSMPTLSAAAVCGAVQSLPRAMGTN